jgi:pimeloyl-ACP methyl ester carboxylesterase
MRVLGTTVFATFAVFAFSPTMFGSTSVKNIVIVHGAFANGSGWKAVANILTNDRYNVTIIENTTASLAADVSETQKVLSKQTGPVVLVGHSYGGAVITEAGNNSNVKALVYIAAFVPDAGESLETLSARPDFQPGPPLLLPPKNGFVTLIPEQFPERFAADVAKIDSEKAKKMANSQLPFGLQAFSDKILTPAWKTVPSCYYTVSTEDRMIPPAAEKWMATRAKCLQSEIKASHAVYITHAPEVAKFIERAYESN